jgi:hypothetical protein
MNSMGAPTLRSPYSAMIPGMSPLISVLSSAKLLVGAATTAKLIRQSVQILFQFIIWGSRLRIRVAYARAGLFQELSPRSPITGLGNVAHIDFLSNGVLLAGRLRHPLSL